KPGMILEAAKTYNIDLASSFMVGDSPRDMEAGKAAGCKTAFLLSGENMKTDEADGIYNDLSEFVLKNIEP
ncbi:MAG TPA: HAD hydrolase-like protein, partial [Clostridiales bacterium]|nr:HAD hydrolase-like protein [Clostridiales bacterium]